MGIGADRSERTIVNQVGAYRLQRASTSTVRTGGVLLACPRCHLQIHQQQSWLAPRQCPRCLARYKIGIALQQQ
jgi:uncharacterized C2H2 Zn-finger protein